MEFRIVCVFILGCWINGVRCLEIVEGPTDDVIMSGEDKLLRCRVEGDLQSDFLEWREFITISSGKKIWISNQDLDDVSDPDKYEILNQFDLKVKNASVQDGGQYGCHLVLGEDTDYRSADVYVFEPAICKAVGDELYEGDEGVVTCRVPYGGGEDTPIVEFFVDGKRVEKNEYTESNALIVYSNITVGAEDDGRKYECRVRLPEPSYSDSCTASLEVFYPVRNISVQPEAEYYVIGDELRCVAMGNPRPEVMWTQVFPDNDVMINGSTLLLEPGMEGEHIWSCYAENTVKGNTTWLETNVTFSVYTSGGNGSNFNLHLLAVLFLLSAFIAAN